MPHHYLDKLLRLAEVARTAEMLPTGAALHAVIAHDAWCAFLCSQGQAACNCDPTITFQATPPKPEPD